MPSWCYIDCMEKEFDSLLYHKHLLWQDQRIRNTFPPNIDPPTHIISSNKADHVNLSQANEPHGWFYYLPRYRESVNLLPTSNLKERLSTFPYGAGGVNASNAAFGVGENRFLVFDQSGIQTNLIFNSANGHPVQNLNYLTPKPNGLEEPKAKRDPIYQITPVLSEGSNENQESDEGSEMHEDTEELNALLYSDDDDDDEKSTGNSPSEEEVASSDRPTKKRKVLDDPLEELKDDAESSCTMGKTLGGEMGSLRGNKWIKKERIRETIRILRNIIPGGQGKDALLVLDEAIKYLKYLKVKTKDVPKKIHAWGEGM